MTIKGRQAAAITAALATGLVLLTLVLTRSGTTLPSEPPAPTEPGHSPASSAGPYEVPSPITPHGGLEIVRSTAAHGWVVLPDAFGTWVAGAGTLTRIDPATGSTRVTARGPWDYDYVRLAEAGEGAIYITSKTSVLAMDAGSGTVITTMTPSLGYVDAVLPDRQGAVWVAASGPSGSQVLAELDANTGKVLRRVDDIGQGLHTLARAGGYLFVGSNGGGGTTLLRVDPRTTETKRVRGVPPGTSFVGVGPHLWIADNGSVRCLDAVTLASCGALATEGFTRMAASGRDLWLLAEHPGTLADRGATITLINGRTGRVVAGPLEVPKHGSSIAAFNGRAWIGYYQTGRIIEVARCARATC